MQVEYPVAEFIIVVGFLLVLLLEQLVLECKGNSNNGRRGGTSQGRNAAEDQSSLLASNEGGHGSLGETPVLQTPPAADIIGPDKTSPAIHDHSHSHHQVLDHSSLRSYLLVLALTFHSVFEGLAIGLQEVSGQLVALFIAVMIHKAIMAFSLGLTLAQSPVGSSWKPYSISVSIFSLASPIGMALGIALTDMKASLGRDIVNSILQG